MARLRELRELRGHGDGPKGAPGTGGVAEVQLRPAALSAADPAVPGTTAMWATVGWVGHGMVPLCLVECMGIDGRKHGIYFDVMEIS